MPKYPSVGETWPVQADYTYIYIYIYTRAPIIDPLYIHPSKKEILIGSIPKTIPLMDK